MYIQLLNKTILHDSTSSDYVDHLQFDILMTLYIDNDIDIMLVILYIEIMRGMSNSKIDDITLHTYMYRYTHSYTPSNIHIRHTSKRN